MSRVGTDIGKYQITRLLGVGGTAAVYAATHRNGQRVAMKFLLEHFAADPELCHRFRCETQVANQVGHPFAVPVLDNDVDGQGCPFLVMPLLEGETLRARWHRERKRLPVDLAFTLLSDVLEVLACAHQRGIVHRDIKPDNLFITTAGRVHVLDFGIARHLEEDGSMSTGRVIGTPAFMAPEQAMGDRSSIGPRSDNWAVGATLFSLLSGEYVHRATGAGARLAAAATRHPRSLSEVAPELPAPIVRFVDKSLAFEPSERWSSAGEMRSAMARAVEDALSIPAGDIVAHVRAQFGGGGAGSYVANL